MSSVGSFFSRPRSYPAHALFLLGGPDLEEVRGRDFIHLSPAFVYSPALSTPTDISSMMSAPKWFAKSEDLLSLQLSPGERAQKLK